MLSTVNSFYAAPVSSVPPQQAYVESGYEALANMNAARYFNNDKEAAKEYVDTLRILPICSDPTKADSDGDYMLDCINNDFVKKSIYWDIKDENPLYAYADTLNNYGQNLAGITVKKTSKRPEEYIVKKTVPLNLM